MDIQTPIMQPTSGVLPLYSGIAKFRDNMIKSEVAGFIQSLMRSCNQRRILPIMLLPDKYEMRVNPLLPVKSERMSQ